MPPGAASTATVKPSTNATREVEPHYTQSCADVLNALEQSPNLKTKLKFAHPWFGPMNAEGWHLLTGLHMSIHRKQIAAILGRL
ncbi:MAG: hypothetical protein EBS01_07225 [Verrucomicrobia bacterium]|nr:hypothetical protein [Verrucomicrobiota bacterium]